MAISTGAAILGGAIGGGLLASRGAKKAGQAQERAASQATEEERRQFELNRADMEPWRSGGSEAINRLRDLMNWGRGGPDTLGERQFTEADFWADPVTRLGHEAGLREGMTSLNRMFGAGGMSKSGAAAKALTRFATDYTGGKANEAYNRFHANADRIFNRLSGMAGTGQTAATNTAAMGNASTGRIGDLITGAGNARGSAAIARGNAMAGGLSTVGNWFTQNQMLDKILNRGSGGGSTFDPYSIS